MATGDDRSRVQIADLDLQKVNEALRRLSDQVARIEGRSGGVNLRDSITLKSEKQTLIDFDSSQAGKAAIVAYGTENATIALAKGARKENNGEWIATDTAATIFSIDRSGNGILYYNSSLTIGQAFSPTNVFTLGVGGSVASHTLTGGATPHTESGLTTGYVLTATGATTFAWAIPKTITAGVALSGGGSLEQNRTIDLDITELTEDTTPDEAADYLVTYDNSATAHKKVKPDSLHFPRTLSVNVTPVTVSSAAAQDLITYTLTGGTLANTGDRVKIFVSGTLAANGNNKAVTINFGSYSLLFVSGTLNNLDWIAEMDVIRTGATTQMIVARGGWNGVWLYCDYADGTETLSGNITIKCTGDGDAASDITQKLMVVEFIPAP